MVLTRTTFFLAALLFASSSPAYSFDWVVDAENSSIEFTALFSGAPSAGRFSTFEATISFDKENLDQSAVNVIVDVNSVEADFPSVAETLVTEPWFNAAAHPTAEFASQSIRLLEDGTYEADGTLTLRGRSQPVTLSFTLAEYGEHPEKSGLWRAIMDGEATVQRTKYNIGQGEWAATSVVADDVVIKVRVTAETVGSAANATSPQSAPAGENQ